MAGDNSDEAKWDKIYQSRPGQRPQPDKMLMSFEHLLPRTGKALDLACGVGGNALWLAARGLEVDAWDISGVALEQLSTAAQLQGFGLNTRKIDLNQTSPPEETWDLIVVTRFLDRDLAAAIAAALTPGGLLFYQTFTREKVNEGAPRHSPRQKDYLLEPNELLALFPTLQVLVFHDEGTVGDVSLGLRNQSCLLAYRAPAFSPLAVQGRRQ